MRVISRRTFVAGALCSAGTLKAQANTGQWSGPYPVPFVSIHLILMADGRVLTWGGQVAGQEGKYTAAYVFDPVTMSSRYAPLPIADVFCAGHSARGDGHLLIAGGHLGDQIGLKQARLFNYKDAKWTSVADMNYARWYPSNCTLGTGETLVVGGTSTYGVESTTPEVFNGHSWRALTGATGLVLGNPAWDVFYPWLHLLPNGLVFVSGPENFATNYLNTSGVGGWIQGPSKQRGGREYGTSVMYDSNKVIIIGGADPPTNTAEVIDLNSSAPSWRYTGSMTYPRRQHNATILPDGTVLVTGGTQNPGFNDPRGAVYAAEIWNPQTGTWSIMSSMQVTRIYHSTAMLLPDGRVLSAGTNGMDNVEFFSPPYLFNGPRPIISQAPKDVHYGASFPVKTPDPAGIAKVSWIRLSAVTHAFNQEQRLSFLPFTRSADAIHVTAPSNRNVSPPGNYMLFILNASGVPSHASIVSIG